MLMEVSGPDWTAVYANVSSVAYGLSFAMVPFVAEPMIDFRF